MGVTTPSSASPTNSFCAAVVEMETADHPVMQQPGHDLLDVLGLIMMAGIDQDVSLWTRRARQ